MILAELEQLVASHAPGSLLPRDWLLEQLRTVSSTDAGDELADLSVEDAGRVLGRSDSTVREYCRANLLPGAYRQRGREWRIPRAAVRAFQRAEAQPKRTPRRTATGDVVDLGAWREEFANGPDGPEKAAAGA
jgi:excisionase family DNA binding protein